MGSLEDNLQVSWYQNMKSHIAAAREKEMAEVAVTTITPRRSKYQLTIDIQVLFYRPDVFPTAESEMSLSFRFIGHFPGEPRLASFFETKDDGGDGDNWTNGAISHAKLQSNHHRQ